MRELLQGFMLQQLTVAFLLACSILATGSVAEATGSFYLTAVNGNGAAAGSLCNAGYHMCGPGEWVGRKIESTSATIGSVAGYIDSAGNNCSNWTTTVGSAQTVTFSISKTTDFGWTADTVLESCLTAHKVFCCSN